MRGMKWHACMSRVVLVLVVVVVVVVAVTTVKTTRNIMTLTGCQQPPPLPLPPHIPSCSSRHFAPPKLVIFIPPTPPPSSLGHNPLLRENIRDNM